MTPRRMILAGLVSVGLVAIEFVLWISWPQAGSVGFFATLLGLQSLEAVGLPTLRGSSSGWPVPTTLGWGLAVLSRLALYFVVVSIIMRLWRRTRHEQQTA